jgi:hypothetical protein
MMVILIVKKLNAVTSPAIWQAQVWDSDVPRPVLSSKSWNICELFSHRKLKLEEFLWQWSTDLVVTKTPKKLSFNPSYYMLQWLVEHAASLSVLYCSLLLDGFCWFESLLLHYLFWPIYWNQFHICLCIIFIFSSIIN